MLTERRDIKAVYRRTHFMWYSDKENKNSTGTESDHQFPRDGLAGEENKRSRKGISQGAEKTLYFDYGGGQNTDCLSKSPSNGKPKQEFNYRKVNSNFKKELKVKYLEKHKKLFLSCKQRLSPCYLFKVVIYSV